jgi:hypothetical protein
VVASRLAATYGSVNLSKGIDVDDLVVVRATYTKDGRHRDKVPDSRLDVPALCPDRRTHGKGCMLVVWVTAGCPTPDEYDYEDRGGKIYAVHRRTSPFHEKIQAAFDSRR